MKRQKIHTLTASKILPFGRAKIKKAVFLLLFSHLTVSLQKKILNVMGDDVFKSISQRIDGTYDEEIRRIKEISDELQKLCRLHEAQLRDGKENVNCYEIEQRPR